MHAISKTEWTMRFAARLRRVSMNAGGLSAMLIALKTYDMAADLDPEEAADTCAQERLADSPGMPGDPG
jgi:hypothetical protein